MQDLSEFQQRACAIGVVKILNGKHFSICDLDALAKTMGRESAMAGKDYDALRVLHCVAWGDMGPELAAMVKEKFLELLGLPQAAIDGVCTREESSNGQAGPHHEHGKPKLKLAFWK